MQNVIVTGGSRGLGLAMARTLAAAGYRIIAIARASTEELVTASRAAADGGRGAIEFRACDLSDLGQIGPLVKALRADFGPIYGLVNNAGIAGSSGPLHELAPETWDEVMNTNLRGVFYCIRSLAPVMIKTGAAHVINISSLAGKNPVPNLAAYSASKWGLNGLSYSVAEELRPPGIRVSVICPGSVHTDFSLHPGKNAEKMLQASDVAHAVAMIVTQAPQSFASEILLRPTQKP